MRLIATIIFGTFLLVVEVVCRCRALIDALFGSSNRAGKPLTVLTIGTFYNANWYRAHLSPLANARGVERLIVVSGKAGDDLKGVQWCVAPAWLSRAIGMNGGRTLAALYATLRYRPDVVIGYFIFPSGLLSLLLARLIGAKAGYQMCGGPLEITDCGVHSDNPVLMRVYPRFPGLQRLLYRLVNQFDLVVVRGRVAKQFCEATFKSTRVEIVSAGINTGRFHQRPSGAKRYDLITVSRVSDWKRLDVIIDAMAELNQMLPQLRTAIVGDGPAMESLRSQARRLGLEDRVEFLGQRDDVEDLLAQSHIFILPSSSEGLSIAMAEAMACGLPAIVSDVGELGELVKNGVNGFLVPVGDVQGFAEAIRSLLTDEPRLTAFGKQAAEDSTRLCGADRISERWSDVLARTVSRNERLARRECDGSLKAWESRR